jgi:hypothetical protein
VEEAEEEANFSGAPIATSFLLFLFCFLWFFGFFNKKTWPVLETAVISFHFCF